jgi:hypothetical protein
MSYSERIRHPDGALNPQPEKKSGFSWWWVIGGGMAALILIGIFRPQWLGKIGIHVNVSGAAKAVGAISNPLGWV